MKKSIFFAVVMTLCSASFIAAQIKITPNLVEYEREGEVPESRKTFSVRYPVFSGRLSKQVHAELVRSIDYWKAFDTSLDEHLKDYFWLESLDYEVKFNNKETLTIVLSMDGSGAYPDRSTRTLVINTKTGKKVEFGDVFTNIGEMLVIIDAAQKQEVADRVLELNNDTAGDGDVLKTEIGNRRYETSVLREFEVSERGVEFLYDYGLPHAVKALEPDGRFFFSWEKMKPFVRRDGLLARFVR